MDKLTHRLHTYIKLQMKQRPFLTSLALFVLACHLLLALYSYIHPMPKLSPNRSKLVVKTLYLPPDPSKPTFTAQEKSIKPPSSALPTKVLASAPKNKKPVAVTKKVPTAPKQKNTVAAAKAKTETPPLPSKTQKLLHELQESIAKIEVHRDGTTQSNTISIPTPIKALKADTYKIESENIEEESLMYRDILIHHLQDTLQLPGYGTVKLMLTLSHEGLVENVAVVYSDSEVNRLYLEKILQGLAFPQFVGELYNKKDYTFCLTFCSD